MIIPLNSPGGSTLQCGMGRDLPCAACWKFVPDYVGKTAVYKDIAVFQVRLHLLSRCISSSTVGLPLSLENLILEWQDRTLYGRLRAHYIGSVMAARRQTAPRNQIGNEIDTVERAAADHTARQLRRDSNVCLFHSLWQPHPVRLLFCLQDRSTVRRCHYRIRDRLRICVCNGNHLFQRIMGYRGDRIWPNSVSGVYPNTVLKVRIRTPCD